MEATLGFSQNSKELVLEIDVKQSHLHQKSQTRHNIGRSIWVAKSPLPGPREFRELFQEAAVMWDALVHPGGLYG